MTDEKKLEQSEKAARPTEVADKTPGQNPETGEVGGPKGPEPTRYGDWEKKGRCIDF